MLTLSSFDIGQYITNWEFNVNPSFEFVELFTGKITKKRDLGISNDKFYCVLDIAVPYTQVSTLKNWYDENRGLPQTITTDLDLFFPNVYSFGSCIPHSLKPTGYVSNYFSKYQTYELTLLHVGSFVYGSSIVLPSVFSRGQWANDYEYAETLNVAENSNNYEFVTSTNDLNRWSVSFDYLTREEAKQILTFLLSIRTTIKTIPKPSILGGDGIGNTDVWFHSFDFQNHQTYYSANIELVCKAPYEP